MGVYSIFFRRSVEKDLAQIPDTAKTFAADANQCIGIIRLFAVGA